MKAKLLFGKSPEQLESNVNDWLKEIESIKSIEDTPAGRAVAIHNVQPFIMQIVTPTVLDPSRGTQETIFQLLIFYS